MEKKFKSKYIGKELITNLGDKYKITEYNNHNYNNVHKTFLYKWNIKSGFNMK